jgi:hypothetical protein
MADSKVTGLSALGAKADPADICYLVDDPTGSATSKKITVDNLNYWSKSAVTGQVSLIDETARATSLVSVQAGSALTPLTVQGVGGFESTIYSSGSNGAYAARVHSTGLASFSAVSAVVALVTPHADDAADSFVAGFSPFLESDAGPAAKVPLFFFDGGSGAMWTKIIDSETGANIRMLEPANDANPQQTYGSTENNALTTIQSYKAGSQDLEFVEFETKSELADANAGQYKFKVDESLILTIDDDGIVVEGGMRMRVTEVTAATYDLASNDYILDVTYTATGAVTSLTIPTAQTVAGRIIVIKDSAGNAGTNNITVDTEGGQNIDGSATAIISGDYDSITLYCDGNNWFII